MTSPVKPGAIEAIRDVKRYHWYRDGMWCADMPLPGDPFPTVGIWVQACAYDQQTLALDSARRELAELRDFLNTTSARLGCEHTTGAADGAVNHIADEYERLSDLVKQYSEAREAEARDANLFLLESVKLRGELKEARELIEEGRRAIGDHWAPNDCYATGPVTGDPIRDLVQCPACSFIAMYDAALSPTKAGTGGT